MGAVMLQSPYATFVRGMRMVRWVWYPPVVNHLQLIQQVSSWSQVSRREGLLALESVINQLKDDFARKGLQLLVDGAEPERLREVLEVEISTYEQEMKLSARIWEAAGGYSPTIGILGAVMGLIHVMENLSDPSKLGAGIAVAFVATIYGVGLANLVFLPMANKLKAHINRLIVQREMIVDGLVGIANGDNPAHHRKPSPGLHLLVHGASKARGGARQPRALAGFVCGFHHPAVRLLCRDVRALYGQ